MIGLPGLQKGVPDPNWVARKFREIEASITNQVAGVRNTIVTVTAKIAGGSSGQALVKLSDLDGDYGWGGPGHTVQDEGLVLAARVNLNFVGSGVTATDDSANNATVVTITAGYDPYPDLFLLGGM